MWSCLLFNRTAFDAPRPGEGRIHNQFPPKAMLREVSVTHESMCAQNHVISTVASVTVLRARAAEGTRETEDLDEEEKVDLMQRTVEFAAASGADRRWSRS